MNNKKRELPDDQDQSAVINKDDAKFENSSIDPGFDIEEVQDSDEKDIKDVDQKSENTNNEGDKKQVRNNAAGLDELDGTNPGSNHHPMDEKS